MVGRRDSAIIQPKNQTLLRIKLRFRPGTLKSSSLCCRATYLLSGREVRIAIALTVFLLSWAKISLLVPLPHPSPKDQGYRTALITSKSPSSLTSKGGFKPLPHLLPEFLVKKLLPQTEFTLQSFELMFLSQQSYNGIGLSCDSTPGPFLLLGLRAISF